MRVRNLRSREFVSVPGVAMGDKKGWVPVLSLISSLCPFVSSLWHFVQQPKSYITKNTEKAQKTQRIIV